MNTKRRLGVMASSLLALTALVASTASVSASTASETVSSPTGGGAVSWVTAPAASFSFPGVTLNGSNQSVTYTPNFDIQDTRGSGAGWNVTLQASTFSTGTVTLNATLTEGSTTWACDTGSTCTVANNGTLAGTYPITVTPGGAAVKILDAGANSGMGAMNTGATSVFTLGVPASATAGTYTSTWTYTIGSAP